MLCILIVLARHRRGVSKDFDVSIFGHSLMKNGPAGFHRTAARNSAITDVKIIIRVGERRYSLLKNISPTRRLQQIFLNRL